MQKGTELYRIQGRDIFLKDIEWLKQYMIDHKQSSRSGIAKALCEYWGWRNGRGHLKDMAARELIDKLEKLGQLKLPSVIKKKGYGGGFCKAQIAKPPIGNTMECCLNKITPIQIHIIEKGSKKRELWAGYLEHYHYLGLRIFGENIGYLVESCEGVPLAALLFGAAAWHCTVRDRYIGWSDEERLKRLNMIANNTRFLILPWIKVPHLASHVLGVIQRRISIDWENKYAHGLEWLETFVDLERFKGTCYKAANWMELGLTKGRGRQDRTHRKVVSEKKVFLFVPNGQKGMCR